MPRILIPLRPILGVLQIGIKSQDTIMSDSEHSAVTYTSASEDDLYMGSPGVEVPVFEGPPSPDYVPGPEEPEQAPPSPIYIPFVPEPVYPEFLPVDDEVFPAEEQPLPAADSPTHQSPGYIPESDPEEDLEEDDEEDPEEDPADYPADRGNDDDEHLAPPSCKLLALQLTQEPHTLLIASWRVRSWMLAGWTYLQLGQLTDFADDEIAPTTLEGVNQRVIELSSTVDEEDKIIYSQLDDARYDRALLRARVNMLESDRPFHGRTAVLMEEEAINHRVRLGERQTDFIAAETDLRRAECSLVENPKIVKSSQALLIEKQEARTC
ncbi:hypothetical protein Tco_0191325 [Tanacetum coccineum]